MDTTVNNKGGYKGTGKTGTFNGVTYNAPTTSSPYGTATVNIPSNLNTVDAKKINNSNITTPTITQPTYSTNAIDTSTAGAKTQSASDALLAEQQAKADTSNKSLTDLYGQLTGVNTDIGNVNASVDRTKANEQRTLADKYTSQIETLQKNTRDQINQLKDTNPEGLSAGAINAKISDINRKSISQQADLALLQSAASNDYKNLSAIADEQVKNNLSALQAKADNLQTFIDMNKSDMTTAENRIYQQKYDQVQAELKKKADNETAISQIKQNVALYAGSSAPSLINQLGQIDTSKPGALDEALKIAGKYGGDYLKQKLLEEQIKNEKASTSKIYKEMNTTSTKPATQSQYTASGFANRVVQAKDIIDNNINSISKLSPAQYLYQRKLPNIFQSPLIQSELQAERNFVNAVLRRESGAAIAPDEFKSAEKQYFPQPGDSAEVLAQKKANRDLTSKNLINESGSAYTAQQNDNPFAQSLGQSNEKIPGTSIIQSVSNGIINFNIPK